MKDVGTQKNDTNFISIRPEIKWKINDPVIRMGSILGILKEKDGQVAISNIIFEKMLSDIVFSKIERSGMIEIPEKSQFVSDGKLDMVNIFGCQKCRKRILD